MVSDKNLYYLDVSSKWFWDSFQLCELNGYKKEDNFPFE